MDITSFGHKHNGPQGGAPTAHVGLDLREHFHDKGVDPMLDELTARDARIRTLVMATPGIRSVVIATVAQVEAYLECPYARSSVVEVAVGCSNGHHRAPTSAMALRAILTGDVEAAEALNVRDLAERFVDRGLQVTLTHRDLDKPAIN
ncbi:ATPase [Actinoallomurus sp. NPDC052274]|uniref:RapZ C-terminal domain-containing protein n=1 Tax=Actinoallomurus sp. NPDC052274 TaxID=3155420 RepID=UPI003444123A